MPAAGHWTPESTVWEPLDDNNLYIKYTIPSGKATTLTSFKIKVLQYQYDGKTVNFEKLGLTVYKNGVPIYTQLHTLVPSDINNSIEFTFPSTPDFTTDGKSYTLYDLRFGLIHRIGNIGTDGLYSRGQTGFDDLFVMGICGGSPPATAVVTPATCDATQGALNNGKITLAGFETTDRYDYTLGSTYTGTASYTTGSNSIPSGGVIVSNLPNPASAQAYTVRVFKASGCTQDLTVTLLPTVCPGACTPPSTSTVLVTSATCSGTVANSNASIAVSGVTGGDKVGMSVGSTYSGPDYSASTSLTGGGYTFANLANPTTTGIQYYTIRIFNGSNTCYIDKVVSLIDAGCTPCTKACAEIIASGSNDPDSSPNNGTITEDDYACFESCKTDTYIDLKLTKTVTPNTGVICPTPTSFTWTVTLKNEGTMAANSIKVQDLFPTDLTLANPRLISLVSVSATKGTTNTFIQDGMWSIDNLQVGEVVTLTFVSNALRAGTLTNCAEVVAALPLNDPDSTPGNGVTTEDDYACASITVTGSTPPTVTKAFSPPATQPNIPVRLTVSIYNNESTPITLTENLVDNLPSSPAQMKIAAVPNVSTTNGVGVIAIGGGTTFYIPTGTVLVPGLTQISLDVVAPQKGFYCNVIDANALKTSACGNVVSTTACLDVDESYVLSPVISKAFSPQIVQVNENSTLTITVENKNAVSMRLNSDFYDALPQGLVVAGTATGTCPGVSTFSSTDKVGILAGTVLAPGTCTVIVPVKSTTTGTYCNRIPMNSMNVTIGTDTNVPNEDMAEACLNVVNTPVFDLALTKKLATGQSTNVLVGDVVTHTIQVINQGTVAATNVQVTDYIPASMSLVADANWTMSGSNAVLTTPIASLSAGQTLSIPIRLKILSGAQGDTLVNKAEISSAGGGTDKDSSPDSNPNNDAGGRYNSPSDDAVNGNGTGQPGDRNALTDEDDEDPDYVVVTQCTNSNLAAGVILSPNVIRSQSDVVQISFGLTNPGSTPVSGIGFTGGVQLRNSVTGTTTPITLTKQGDVGNDGIMQPNESWIYTGTFSSTYSPGDVFVVTGSATAVCGSSTINAATADQIFTVGVNMDVRITDKCYQPGSKLEVDLITRLLIDEDAAVNPGTITVNGIVVPLAKRRFEARGLMITIQGVNNNQPFDPFNPPAGITLTKFTDQGGADGGRNTANVLDELDPVNTVRAPCTAFGENDKGCEFPDWVFHIQIPVPANYTGSTFSVSASDQFQLFQSVENPAGSGTYDAFTDITPGTGAGGADTDIVPVCLDLALTKKLATGQAATVASGSTVKFTITVYNQGSVPAYNVKVIDYIPAGLTLNDPNWTLTSPTTATLTNPIAGPLAVGASTSVDVTFTVAAGATGNLINKAEIIGADDDTDPTNTPPFDNDSKYDTDPTNDAGGAVNTPSDDAINGNGTGQPGDSNASTDEDDEDPAQVTVNNCTKPVLTAGNVNCQGTTYSILFYSSTNNVTSSAGTISGNQITGIPLGTNVVLTATESAGCATTLTVEGPASCPTTCTLPQLTVGQPICNGTTYSVSFLASTGALVTGNVGTVSGNSIINIPIGTNVIVTATMGSCSSNVDVVSPASCASPCENPGISISGPVCDASNTSYHLNYTLSSGATVSASVGTVTGTQVTGIPLGQSVTLTIKVSGCPDKVVVVPAPASCPVFDLALTKKLASGQSANVVAGSNVTFTITVINQGTVDATNIQVTDYIPTGMTLSDANWTLSNGMATLNTSIASLPAGQSTTRNITFTVGSAAAGNLTNTAEISSASNAQNLPDKDSTPDNDPTNDGTPVNDDTSGDHKNNPSQDEDDSDPETITVTPLKACLGDYVWLDTNQNGVQDNGETGVAGVTAVLYDATSGTVVSTTVTDGTGHYQFCNLNPGSYYVKFTAPTGMTFTTPNSGGDDTKDSDVSSTTGSSGTTPVVSLTPGENNTTVDAGLVPQKACLGDYVWLDTNQNGVQDNGETGVAGVTAVLYDAVSGTVVSTTVTDGTGHYQFCNLNPGSYYVKFTAPTGMTFTTPNSGGDDTKDSDVSSTTGSSGTTPVVSLTPGENNPTIDAGLIPTPVFDLALTKKLASGQSANVVAGSNVTFTVTIYNQGNVDATNIQVTDYIPTGMTLSDANWTLSNGKATLNTAIASLPAGQSTTRNITFTVGAGVTGSLTNTAEISNASNAQNLPDKDSTPDNDPTNDGTPVNDDTSGDHKNNPSQDEDDSDPETITVSPAPVFDLALTKKLASGQSANVVAGSNVTFTITVINQGTVDATNVQVTDYIPTGMTLSDANWTLSNGMATLNTAIASLPAGQSTTRNITFTVGSAAAGSVTNVAEISGASNALNLPDKDSTPDNDPTNDGTPVNDDTSGDHKNNPSQDEDDSDPETITVTPLKACLGDYVWYDNNKNGQQDAGEPAAVGVTVTLYDAVTNQPVNTTVTDGQGKYLFCNLNPGTYYVVFTAPSGATFTTPNTGNDATDSDAGTGGRTGNYTLVGGQQELTVDAGLIPQCTSPNCTTIITVK